MYKIQKAVDSYYSEKLKEYGSTARGMDWKNEASQMLRFEQLLDEWKGLSEDDTILDYGCGCGHLCKYMYDNGISSMYVGYDVSEAMLVAAQEFNKDRACKWINELKDGDIFDYSIASGVLNVKLSFCNEEWFEYVLYVLDRLNRHSKKGFAFNALTKYSDKEFMKANLYYSDPLVLFDICKKKYSKYVVLNHGYELYEFTLIVKKE